MGGNGAGGLTIINMNSHVSRSFQLPVSHELVILRLLVRTVVMFVGEKWVLLHKLTSELLLDGEKAILLISGGGGTCLERA